jgi:hypothetical protein
MSKVRVIRRMPPHILREYGTTRSFKQSKRAEIRVLREALKLVNLGCAYIPDGPHMVYRIENLVNVLARNASLKVWGR